MRDPDKWNDCLFPDEPKALTRTDWVVMAIAAVVQIFSLCANCLQIKLWLFN